VSSTFLPARGHRADGPDVPKWQFLGRKSRASSDCSGFFQALQDHTSRQDNVDRFNVHHHSRPCFRSRWTPLCAREYHREQSVPNASHRKNRPDCRNHSNGHCLRTLPFHGHDLRPGWRDLRFEQGLWSTTEWLGPDSANNSAVALSQ